MERKTTEKHITTCRVADLIASQPKYIFSPDCRHIATIRKAPDGQFVVLDDAPQKKYDSIKHLVFSPDSEQLAYYGPTAQGYFVQYSNSEFGPFNGMADYLVISNDSKHFAFNAAIDHSWYAVVDGNRSGPHKGIMENTPAFSPDCKRMAYCAYDENSWRVFVDDEIQGPYEGVGNLTFSQDSRKVAYKVQARGKEYIVVDGVPEKEFDKVDNPHFSPDGSLLVYSAQLDRKWRAIINGMPDNPYDDVYVGDWSISQAGNRVAYRGIREKMSFLVLDGVEQGPYEDIILGSILFSPDSSKVTYQTRSTRKKFGLPIGNLASVVMDGKPGLIYDEATSVVFSSDSHHYAYIGDRKKEGFMVIDGKEIGPFEKVYPCYPFSPDCTRTSFIVKERAQIYLISNNDRYGPYADASYNLLSTDNKWLIFAATKDNHDMVVVNGQPGQAYEVVSAPTFDSPNQFHYIAYRGDEFFLVDETVTA